MNSKIYLSIFVYILCVCYSPLFGDTAGDSMKLRRLLEKEFPGIKIESKALKDDYTLVWKLIIQQPLDHWNPVLGRFPQQILLYHKSFKKPNVIVTEGYNIIDRIYEASLILDANQFSVEYRFFGESAPDTINWKLLNHKQALEDLHQIRSKLAKIYKKSWTATGISKGGTTTALYSLSYPEDLKAAIAYVAPFPLAQEDPRTVEHYKNQVGSQECRKKVHDFQRMILSHRNELKEKLKELEERDHTRFDLDKDMVIDFTSMEYPFSFWQWGFGCQEIPGTNASTQEIFDHIEEVVDFNYYDHKSCTEFLPAYYQFMTEFGYYGFDTTGLSDLLLYPHLSNLEFCPKNADLSYDGRFFKEMNDKATKASKNIIYIYGGLDTWTSCAVHPAASTNALKLVKYNGGHRTRVRDFAENERQKVYENLKKWTGVKTKPLPY